ncbi:PEP-CTERM sorting domain-containing protein [Methylotenera sp.]|uniref:PEP-CTERM sorting domain-containing protein n=1 Tax=Methylotenera sp. TaxID=2051956 RepID=UPI002486F499|nr:PEP-CTERM sorting domain-containing protein [Methylotenera sp.]MDI1361105.1 PEP-CTERM sorting domain-containing protein [Methylotenera sp.]
MNFKLKALVAAAVVATTMSGAANALTNNEMFLVAYDAAASKTFIAALGQAGSVSAFTGNTDLSISYAADANWTNFITGATAGGVTYQVLGFYQSNAAAPTSYNAGDRLLATSNTTPNSFSNSGMNGLMSDVAIASGGIAQFESLNAAITGTSTGLITGGGFDSGAKVSTNVFGKYNAFNATAALGDSLNFYSITRPVATSNVTQTVKTQFLTNGVGSTGDTWNLNAAGQLTYIAAVPEADSWAMAMLGLGLMGFVARRRTRA